MTRRSGSTPDDAALAAFAAPVDDGPLTAFLKTDDGIWPPAIAVSPAAAAPAAMRVSHLADAAAGGQSW